MAVVRDSAARPFFYVASPLAIVHAPLLCLTPDVQWGNLMGTRLFARGYLWNKKRRARLHWLRAC